jgi:hypothetical protein
MWSSLPVPAVRRIKKKAKKMRTLEKIHPFESAGLGVGPFVFVCSVEIGDPEDGASFMNSSRIQSEQAKKFKVGFGTCDHCGRGIMHNAVIRDSEGKHFVVGMDCAQKTNDPCLANKAKLEQRRITREKRQERKRLKQEAWLNTVCETGETNGERELRERDERIAETNRRNEKREAEERKLGLATLNKWKFWLESTGARPDSDGFLGSIVCGLIRGCEPTGRGLEICGDIFARQSGRRGSNANEEAWTIFDQKLSA